MDTFRKTLEDCIEPNVSQMLFTSKNILLGYCLVNMFHFHLYKSNTFELTDSSQIEKTVGHIWGIVKVHDLNEKKKKKEKWVTFP